MTETIHPFPESRNNRVMSDLYGESAQTLAYQHDRYREVITLCAGAFHTDEVSSLYSAPGRIEIGGNHTDHNHGRVLAASINLDSIAAVLKNNENKIVLYSKGYESPFIVDLENVDPVNEERGNTAGLIRGIAARFKAWGYEIGGFNCFISSEVLPGSGLSSSASIEVLVGTILSDLYNKNTISYIEIAMAGQFAENNYFGKPCGLMDQIACAAGGIVAIDFAFPENPAIEKVSYDFSEHGYRIVVINTGGDHAHLTEDYAAIPEEMNAVAALLHKEKCRDIDPDSIIKHIDLLREKAGDRAVLRAMHFLGENERVVEQVNALKKNDLKRFLQYVSASGNSSWKWLQNTYSPHSPGEQPVTLALALTERWIEEIGEGACRVHGGGFAGTILAFIPDHGLGEYSALMTGIFGEKAVNILSIRDTGSLRLWP